MQHHIYVFDHSGMSKTYKKIKSSSSQGEAFVDGCKIIHALAKDFKEDLYVFMEQKDLVFDSIEWNGVHIYNGNIGWSVFVTGCLLEEKIIGPIGYKKAKNFYSGFPKGNN
tara:strand:+ start:208 stop:540 length:333 start_codon:yes stop_codon:yes gene_type:complete